jgi:hypothetical protein
MGTGLWLHLTELHYHDHQHEPLGRTQPTPGTQPGEPHSHIHMHELLPSYIAQAGGEDARRQTGHAGPGCSKTLPADPLRKPPSFRRRLSRGGLLHNQVVPGQPGVRHPRMTRALGRREI